MKRKPTAAFVLIALVLLCGCTPTFASPATVEQLLQEANTQNAGGDYEDAILAYNQVALVDPHNFAAQYGMGKAYLATGEYPRAIAALQQAHDQQPNDKDIVLALGEALVKNKSEQEAGLLLLPYESDPVIGKRAKELLDSLPLFAPKQTPLPTPSPAPTPKPTPRPQCVRVDVSEDRDVSDGQPPTDTATGYDAAGNVVWTRNWEISALTELNSCTDAVLSQGVAYFAVDYQMIAADANTGETIWWNKDDSGGFAKKPLFVNGVVYTCSYYGEALIGFSAQTGKVLFCAYDENLSRAYALELRGENIIVYFDTKELGYTTTVAYDLSGNYVSSYRVYH